MTAASADRPVAARQVDAPCTICRSDVADLAHMVDGHRIVRCSGCSHLYVSPRPAMEDVVSIYGADYFENPAFSDPSGDAYYGYADYLNERPNIQLRARQLLRRIEQHVERGKLLDVGCGMGFFVEMAARSGWDAWGIDINEHAVAWARQHVGEQVSIGTLADLGGIGERFDCITMFDVIEHVADPRAELRAVWDALRPGGLLVVLTPDAGARLSRALGSHWLEMKRAPEHLHFFTVPGLATMLEHAGFDPIEWHSAGKIASIRNFLADLQQYGPRLFRGIERALDRVGLTDAVLDVDPRTKLCMYARKRADPEPLERFAPSRSSSSVPRARDPHLGRAGVRRATAPATG